MKCVSLSRKANKSLKKILDLDPDPSHHQTLMAAKLFHDNAAKNITSRAKLITLMILKATDINDS